MHKSLKNLRFTIKPFIQDQNKPVELARTLAIHPLTYQELPYDPEYSQYAGRLTTEKLNNATPDEQYWKTRKEIILRHTGEHPYEISGPDALNLLQKIFPRDISKVRKGRCSYQFACYHDGGMITDGLLLRIEEDKFWFAQADGEMFTWYKANAQNLDVKISEPNVWVSQIQGPLSMELLDHLVKEKISNRWKYFDWEEVIIANEKVIISRTGFTNELGWEIYFRPENNTEAVGDLILEEGKKMGMIITATPSFRGRRIEAGLLSAGQDFTKDTNPFSVGLGRFVDLEKKDFIGKSALINSDKKCKTWGIRVVEGVAKKGETISLNNKIIGKVTSSTWSPYQVCGVGIVHMQDSEYKPGLVVDVDCVDGKSHKAQLCELPMYDPKGEIVRGLKKDIPEKPKPWLGIENL
ncbi:MAG: aminomethyltransferase [Pelagibacteraceae bacterium BACL5 MAG-120705-bin12]|jgi:glycine cleavage system aminomethyltransferase T|nr:MAG: aminomethyltransferase [Pelagibacteraceae bacterium BACL5 MAG-121015-bin10]KRO59897.1 MAG: aminomethyltransferase [Pelagibacteraceae bacterium BACL5 MAG-120705-bin12]